MGEYSKDITVPRTRADCVATIGGMISDLTQIAKTVPDCMSRCDLAQMLDCLFLFYSGYSGVKSQIMSYSGILTEEEIMRFLGASMAIEKDLRDEMKKLIAVCQLQRG